MTVQIHAQVNVLPYPLPLDIQGELLYASTVSLEQSIATINEVHQAMVRRYACRLSATTAWDDQGQLLRVFGLPELVEALNVGVGPEQDKHPTVAALHNILRRGRAEIPPDANSKLRESNGSLTKVRIILRNSASQSASPRCSLCQSAAF